MGRDEKAGKIWEGKITLFAGEKKQNHRTILLFHRHRHKKTGMEPLFRKFMKDESFFKEGKNPNRILNDHLHLLDQGDLLPPESFGSSCVLSRFFSGVPSSTDLIPPLKFLMALPNPDPISGNRLAPKMRKMIARMITSSCVPSPNNLLTPLGFPYGAVYSRLQF